MLKLLKKLSSNHLVLAISAVVLLYAFYNYSNNKSLVVSGLEMRAPANGGSVGSCGTNFTEGENNLAANSGPQGVSGIGTRQAPQPCARGQALGAGDLLPKGGDNAHTSNSPRVEGNLMENVSGTTLAALNGAVSDPMRNFNFDLRGDIAVPRQQVGPWNQSTIQQSGNRSMNLSCGVGN